MAHTHQERNNKHECMTPIATFICDNCKLCDVDEKQGKADTRKTTCPRQLSTCSGNKGI